MGILIFNHGLEETRQKETVARLSNEGRRQVRNAADRYQHAYGFVTNPVYQGYTPLKVAEESAGLFLQRISEKSGVSQKSHEVTLCNGDMAALQRWIEDLRSAHPENGATAVIWCGESTAMALISAAVGETSTKRIGRMFAPLHHAHGALIEPADGMWKIRHYNF